MLLLCGLSLWAITPSPAVLLKPSWWASCHGIKLGTLRFNIAPHQAVHMHMAST